MFYILGLRYTLGLLYGGSSSLCILSFTLVLSNVTL